MTQSVRITVVSEDMIQSVARHIAAEFDPDKIILFGSYGYGLPRAESDVDLLVVMQSTERPMDRALPILKRCRPRFVAMDVLVRTPQEIEERLRIGAPFFSEIVSRGRVLYERRVH